MPLPPRPSRADSRTSDCPTVDVFVPTYNEDAELLANTLAAAKAMDYPADKLTVWLLDDGGTRAETQRSTRSPKPDRRGAAPASCSSSAPISASAI